MDETESVQAVAGVEQAVTASPPSDALIIIPVRDLVLFPGMVILEHIPLTFTRTPHAWRNFYILEF